MLISQMLQVNVEARFTADEVLSHPWVTVSDWRIGSSKSLINFYTDDGDEFLQDEAPPVDSITVSNAEEQDIEEDLDPDEDSPTLETRQVPSPVVWSLLSHQQLEAEDTTALRNLFRFFFLLRSFFFFFIHPRKSLQSNPKHRIQSLQVKQVRLIGLQKYSSFSGDWEKTHSSNSPSVFTVIKTKDHKVSKREQFDQLNPELSFRTK